jgi:hypothetical protein
MVVKLTAHLPDGPLVVPLCFPVSSLENWDHLLCGIKDLAISSLSVTVHA